jgi:hypothetical protein
MRGGLTPAGSPALRALAAARPLLLPSTRPVLNRRPPLLPLPLLHPPGGGLLGVQGNDPQRPQLLLQGHPLSARARMDGQPPPGGRLQPRPHHPVQPMRRQHAPDVCDGQEEEHLQRLSAPLEPGQGRLHRPARAACARPRRAGTRLEQARPGGALVLPAGPAGDGAAGGCGCGSGCGRVPRAGRPELARAGMVELRGRGPGSAVESHQQRALRQAGRDAVLWWGGQVLLILRPSGQGLSYRAINQVC